MHGISTARFRYIKSSLRQILSPGQACCGSETMVPGMLARMCEAKSEMFLDFFNLVNASILRFLSCCILCSPLPSPDESGKDQGINVRQKVKEMVEFVQDDDRLREERKKAKKNKDKYIGVSSDSTGGGFGKTGCKFHHAVGEGT